MQRPFVAPSLCPGSISILNRQPKLQGASLALSEPSAPSLKEAHLGFNFQSFSRGQSPLSRKELLLLSLYCLIQAVSLFKNILGFFSKGWKNYKKILQKK